MALEKDVVYMLNKDWEPKVPEKEIILKQAQFQLKRGRSTGDVGIDVKALKLNKLKSEILLS